ncbi:hypothetical protein PMAYCL1PPCAC_02231, partial [Pristionchus mayeri]
MEGIPCGNRPTINYDLLEKLDDKCREEGMTDEEWAIRRIICTDPSQTMDYSRLTNYGRPFVSHFPSTIPTADVFSSSDEDEDEEESNEENVVVHSDPPPPQRPTSSTSSNGALIDRSTRENGVVKPKKKNPFNEALEIAKRNGEIEKKRKEEEEKRLREEEEKRMREDEE